MSTTQHAAYPLRLEAAASPDASRALWLVKWVLAIPHYLVLAFLWVVFVVLTVAAGVAILVTGRYPRGLFEVNLGILRWSWRVAYYAYGVIGTDRYPPFSLEENADYPARLDIAYPGELSRGLVLVKWWLLALPHYLLILVLVGSFGWLWDADGVGGQVSFVVSILGLLVLVTGLVLLVRGRYPRPLYDLLVGLHRWMFRVVAYAGLMTDDYPPFRLDQGPQEPGPPR